MPATNGRPPRSATALLTEAARAAGHAPSIHNTQPWRWRVSADGLDLYAERGRQLGITDPEGRLLLVFGREGRGPGEFWLPTGIFIDGHDRIWVADSYNRRVQVFDYLPAVPKPQIGLPPAGLNPPLEVNR